MCRLSSKESRILKPSPLQYNKTLQTVTHLLRFLLLTCRPFLKTLTPLLLRTQTCKTLLTYLYIKTQPDLRPFKTRALRLLILSLPRQLQSLRGLRIERLSDCWLFWTLTLLIDWTQTDWPLFGTLTGLLIETLTEWLLSREQTRPIKSKHWLLLWRTTNLLINSQTKSPQCQTLLGLFQLQNMFPPLKSWNDLDIWTLTCYLPCNTPTWFGIKTLTDWLFSEPSTRHLI